MANNDFKIEVPISVKGDTSGKKFGQGIAEQIKKSLGSIGIGKEGGKGDNGISTKILGVATAGTAAVLGILGLLKPVMNLFKAIMVLLFWPLIPYFKNALIALGDFAGKMKEGGGGVTGAIGAGAAPTERQISLGAGAYENIGTAITGALVIAVGVAIAAAAPFVAGATIGIAFGVALLGAMILFAPQIAEGIVNSIGEFWSGLLAIVLIGAGATLLSITLFALGGWILVLVGLLTSAIVAFLPELTKFGTWLWGKITGFISSGMDILKGIGSWIWDKVTGFFDGGGNSTSVDDAIITPQGVVHTNPQDYIIATKDPSSLGGGKSITIQINNPSVRNDMDIKKIANQVSQVLQRQMSGRISAG